MADIPLRKDIRFWLSFLLSVLAIWYTWSQNQTNSDLGSIFFAEPTVVAQGCGSSETFQLIGTGWLADQTVDVYVDPGVGIEGCLQPKPSRVGTHRYPVTNGQFTFPVELGGDRPVGDYPITAVGTQSEHEATWSFSVGNIGLPSPSPSPSALRDS
jgi:hypothetical protein